MVSFNHCQPVWARSVGVMGSTHHLQPLNMDTHTLWSQRLFKYPRPSRKAHINHEIIGHESQTHYLKDKCPWKLLRDASHPLKILHGSWYNTEWKGEMSWIMHQSGFATVLLPWSSCVSWWQTQQTADQVGFEVSSQSYRIMNGQVQLLREWPVWGSNPQPWSY